MIEKNKILVHIKSRLGILDQWGDQALSSDAGTLALFISRPLSSLMCGFQTCSEEWGMNDCMWRV